VATTISAARTHGKQSLSLLQLAPRKSQLLKRGHGDPCEQLKANLRNYISGGGNDENLIAKGTSN
jgi:hypothetical protein